MFNFFKRKTEDQAAKKKNATPADDAKNNSHEPGFGLESLEGRVLLSGTTLGMDMDCGGNDDFDLLDSTGDLNIGDQCGDDLLDGLIEDDNPVDTYAKDDTETKDEPRSGGGTDGRRSKGGTDGPRSKGGTDGPRSKGGTDGRRSGGGTDGRRSKGGTDGRRSKGGTDGRRSKGGTDGRRTKGGADGPRSKGGTDGKRSKGGTDGRRDRGSNKRRGGSDG